MLEEISCEKNRTRESDCSHRKGERTEGGKQIIGQLLRGVSF